MQVMNGLKTLMDPSTQIKCYLNVSELNNMFNADLKGKLHSPDAQMHKNLY